MADDYISRTDPNAYIYCFREAIALGKFVVADVLDRVQRPLASEAIVSELLVCKCLRPPAEFLRPPTLKSFICRLDIGNLDERTVESGWR